MSQTSPSPAPSCPTLHGRSSSHFTRLTRIFALEAGLDLDFRPVRDLGGLDPRSYGDHPALKIPLLRIDDETVLGAENICRRLAEAGSNGLSVTWTEHLPGVELRNAQELVWQGMHTQTQLVFGLLIADLPPENIYFTKAQASLDGTLDWLEARWARLERRIPARDISLLEASLFCLLEHLEFRGAGDGSSRPHLRRFRDDFGRRPSARATAYHFDQA
jgi:glutathione S-transferase